MVLLVLWPCNNRSLPALRSVQILRSAESQVLDPFHTWASFRTKSTNSTFFWICKIPDSVETSKSNFKSKFCWGPRATKKEFRSFQKTKSKFLKSQKIPEFVSKIPILGDAVVSFFSLQPMHRKYSPLLLLLFFIVFITEMERQPTPPLEEIDPDTLVEETKKGEANGSSSTSSNSSTSSSNSPILDDNSSTTDEEQETADEQPLTEYHAKNYFNSTMGGKDL